MSRQGFLVREAQGTYHVGTGRDELTPLGVEQSLQAAKQLRELGVTEQAIILTSHGKRARQTAAYIGHALGCSELPFENPILHEAGISPSAVKSMAAIVDPMLRQANLGQQDRETVLVTHAGLVAAVSGNTQVAPGEVVPVAIDEWLNADYDPRSDRYLEHMIKY